MNANNFPGNNTMKRAHEVVLITLSVFLLALPALTGFAQQSPTYRIHDWNRPRPPVVDPGSSNTQEQPGKAPSDATVLFDGKDLSQWCSMDGSAPKWIIKDGVMECVRGSGFLRTLQNFGDCQLHIEFATPVPPQGKSQGRGNSGVFMMGIYEIQVLDNYDNPTYADGYSAAVYGEYPPLVNACRPPGQWQSYDIIFARPRFDDKEQLVTPSRVTVLQNGVLVQNNVAIKGPTNWMTRDPYKWHADKLPLALQDHGNPVRYRNIWVRELTDAGEKEFTYSRELLDRYTGTYQIRWDLSIGIVRKDNQLYMKVITPGREHEHPLFAESKTKFFAKDVDSYVIFQTNDQGNAESLTWYMGGDTQPAKKVK
jgi:hypothetical protein